MLRPLGSTTYRAELARMILKIRGTEPHDSSHYILANSCEQYGFLIRFCLAFASSSVALMYPGCGCYLTASYTQEK